MELVRVWGEFVALGIAILISGYYLCLYGDRIADKTGLGRTWVGAILLATVTSLPELATGISAVTLADSPDLVVGELLGSCLFNLLILMVLDLLNPGRSLYARADHGHVITAAFGCLLIAFVGFSVISTGRLPDLRLGHIGWYSLLIPVGYGFAMRQLFDYEAERPAKPAEAVAPAIPGTEASLTLPALALRYLFAASVVVGAGVALPVVAEKIVVVMGWNEAFVGTLFIAVSTSLPEVSVTLSALGLGAVDLAISNLVGSNLFNVAILPICDFFYLKGPILNHVSLTHGSTALTACMMTMVVVAAILRPPRRKLIFTWTSWMLLFFYALNTWVIFGTGGH